MSASIKLRVGYSRGSAEGGSSDGSPLASQTTRIDLWAASNGSRPVPGIRGMRGQLRSRTSVWRDAPREQVREVLDSWVWHPKSVCKPRHSKGLEGASPKVERF